MLIVIEVMIDSVKVWLWNSVIGMIGFLMKNLIVMKVVIVMIVIMMSVMFVLEFQLNWLLFMEIQMRRVEMLMVSRMMLKQLIEILVLCCGLGRCSVNCSSMRVRIVNGMLMKKLECQFYMLVRSLLSSGLLMVLRVMMLLMMFMYLLCLCGEMMRVMVIMMSDMRLLMLMFCMMWMVMSMFVLVENLVIMVLIVKRMSEIWMSILWLIRLVSLFQIGVEIVVVRRFVVIIQVYWDWVLLRLVMIIGIEVDMIVLESIVMNMLMMRLEIVVKILWVECVVLGGVGEMFVKGVCFCVES